MHRALPCAEPLAPPWPRRRIGLLGGSFNPPHSGHLAISLDALERLELDDVWWLVAPQNPLKDASSTAPYEKRLAAATAMTRHPRVHASDLEQRHGLTYTVETVAFLRTRMLENAFVWLMGADAFAGLHEWKDWTRIMESIPVAVLARPGFTLATTASRAAQRYARFRLPEHRAAELPFREAPAWTLLHLPLRPESSTAIRAEMPY
jgi:nicotinate-nucleotide adenylyltransferase